MHEVYADVLNSAQKRILPALAEALAGSGLYLAGGTALALQVGHRLSVDFDWFGPRIGNPEILLSKLHAAGLTFTVLSNSFETLYVEIDAVQVSFIGYRYPLIRPLSHWEQHAISLASLDDIACMKLSAVTNRGLRKDFIDLHHLITNFKPLTTYLDLFQKKYKQQDIGHVIRSLVFFEDADLEPELNMFAAVDWSEVKEDFETWVSGMMR